MNHVLTILIFTLWGWACNLNANESADIQRFPQKLSEWNLFEVSDHLIRLKEGVVPYTLKNPLFSDYADKFRTILVPSGKKVAYRQSDIFDFPPGTIISKTFGFKQLELSFPDQDTDPKDMPLNIGFGNAKQLSGIYRIETRILYRQQNVWLSIPYVWDKDQKDATLALIGHKKKIQINHDEIGERSFTYQVPNFNQCKSCHVKYVDFSKPVLPIGPRAINLNHSFQYEKGSVNQLEHWTSKGILAGLPEQEARPVMAAWDDDEADLGERARSYLFANCAHCHGRQGPASTSGLFLGLEINNPLELGICKTPVAVGNGGSDEMKVDISPGDPEHSILYHRLSSEDPAVMMPELGRTIVHRKGVALIYNWIAQMEGDCDTLKLNEYPSITNQK